MSEKKVYKRTEITATSPDSYEDAIRSGVDKVSKTVRNLSWFTVQDFRGSIGQDGKVEEFQVTLMVAFLVD